VKARRGRRAEQFLKPSGFVKNQGNSGCASQSGSLISRKLCLYPMMPGKREDQTEGQ